MPVPLSEMEVVPPLNALLLSVSVPVDDDSVVGVNDKLSVVVWLGFSVSGKVIPEIPKPVPLTLTLLSIRATVPLADSVTGCVAVVFSITLPKATLVVLAFSATVAAFNCNGYVTDTPAAVAVRVAVCAVVTAVAVAVKGALEAPAPIAIEAGAVTELLLLVRFTVTGLVAAEVRVTVQASVAAPVSDALVQETALSVAPGCPVPLSVMVGELGALLLIVTLPLAAPVDVGSKPTVRTAVCPGFRVIGALIPDTENAAPVAVAPLRISCAVPEDVTVTVWLVGVLTRTFPKATFVVLRLRPGTTAFSCNGYVTDTPAEVAVRVAVCAVVTAVAVAVNAALAAPAATVTEAGTVTALLLLVKLTVIAVAAVPVRVTAHASVAAPVSAALPQETALNVAPGCPVPLSVMVGELEALLPIVTDPLAAPVDVGSKPMVSTAVCPGFRVIGAPIPDTENAVPVTVAPFRISCAIPEEVTVTV